MNKLEEAVNAAQDKCGDCHHWEHDPGEPGGGDCKKRGVFRSCATLVRNAGPNGKPCELFTDQPLPVCETCGNHIREHESGSITIDDRLLCIDCYRKEVAQECHVCRTHFTSDPNVNPWAIGLCPKCQHTIGDSLHKSTREALRTAAAIAREAEQARMQELHETWHQAELIVDFDHDGVTGATIDIAAPDSQIVVIRASAGRPVTLRMSPDMAERIGDAIHQTGKAAIAVVKAGGPSPF